MCKWNAVMLFRGVSFSVFYAPNVLMDVLVLKNFWRAVWEGNPFPDSALATSALEFGSSYIKTLCERRLLGWWCAATAFLTKLKSGVDDFRAHSPGSTVCVVVVVVAAAAAGLEVWSCDAVHEGNSVVHVEEGANRVKVAQCEHYDRIIMNGTCGNLTWRKNSGQNLA